MNKTTPLPVKILAVLGYIFAALGVIGGILFLVQGIFSVGIVSGIVESFGAGGTGLFQSVFGGLVVVFGLIAIAISFVEFLVAKGLWNGKNWARVLVVIVCTLGTLSGLVSILSGENGYVSFIIYAGIGSYLMFNKAVKQGFSNESVV
jgi:hypothetical protein